MTEDIDNPTGYEFKNSGPPESIIGVSEVDGGILFSRKLAGGATDKVCIPFDMIPTIIWAITQLTKEGQ